MAKALQPPFVLKSLGTQMSVSRRRRWHAVLASLYAMLFIGQSVMLFFSYRYSQFWFVFVGLAVSYLGNAVFWFVLFQKQRAGAGAAARG